MRRIPQTKFGANNGNCLQAAIASVLEREIENVPNFSDMGDRWFWELHDWCREQGIGLIDLEPEGAHGVLIVDCWAVLIYEVVGQDEDHAIVGRFRSCGRDPGGWEWEVVPVFDPNETEKRLGGLLHIIVLVPGQKDGPDGQ